MADHFVSKQRVAPEDFIEVEGQSALSRFAAFRALLAERAGPEVADLFAEPLVSQGNDSAPPTVSWYSDKAGEQVPLAQLGPGERARVEAYVADHLRPVQALTEDPQHADMANAALTSLGQDNIVVVDGQPVVVNWGLMPGARGASPAARGAHQAATLGRFVAAPAKAQGRTQGASSVPSSGVVPPTPPVSPTAQTSEGLPRIAWVPLVVLLVLAGGVLVWLLLPGTRVFARDGAVPAISDQSELDAARAHNAALRDRKEQLQAALNGAMCRPDGTLILPGGLTPEGLTPPPQGAQPEDKAEAAPDALLPSNPARVVVEDGQSTLLDTITARTVLVLAQGGGEAGVGSGFVVGPGLIVTNQHVIAQATGAGGSVFVTSDALGAPVQAEVLKSRGPLKATGQDFALLRIARTDLPAFSLYVGDNPLTLSNVVAAGYPGDVLEFDVDFAALRAGDGAAVPAITVTDGIVNTEQQIGPATRVLMHSAALSQGNSGGPLVDMCGRVVGVNSFVRRGPMQNRGYALSTGDLLAFLGDTSASPGRVETTCAPLVVRPQITQAASEPAPAPDSDPGSDNSAKPEANPQSGNEDK